MTSPNGELPPVGTFEHALRITTGLGPNLQAVLDRGATPGKGWFIQAGGDLAPGSAQVDGGPRATGFSYHAWDVWYVSVNKNLEEIENWTSGVTEVDGMIGGLAAADIGKIDVNYFLNTKELLDGYISWLASAHETLAQWAGRIGAGDSAFHGLAAHVIANRVIQLGTTVEDLHRQLTTDKNPPPSQALQQNADALSRFGREMAELWNEYSGTLHTAVHDAMDAVVRNIYHYIVNMGLDVSTSNPYVLDTLAENGRARAEEYIRTVIAGYHSNAGSAPEFRRDVRAIAGSYQSHVVIEETGESRTFEPYPLPEGMEPFGGPLDSQATWDLINSRISDYVRKQMKPLNERAVELLDNLGQAYLDSKPAFVAITDPNTPLGGNHGENHGSGGGNGEAGGNGNGPDGADGAGGENGSNGDGRNFVPPPPADGHDEVNFGPQGGDGESTGNGQGGPNNGNGQGDQAFVEPPSDGAGGGDRSTGPNAFGPVDIPSANGNGEVNLGNGEGNFAGGGGGQGSFPGGGDVFAADFTGGDGAGGADGFAGANGGDGPAGANGDAGATGVNGGRSGMGTGVLPPFLPPGGLFGGPGAGTSNLMVPPSMRNNLRGGAADDDGSVIVPDELLFAPEEEGDDAEPTDLDFGNVAPESADGIEEAAVPDSEALLKGLTGSGRPDGAVHVPGLTDQGSWTGGDFDALSEQAIDLTAGPDGTGRDSTVLPPGGSLRAPEAGESVFPNGGLDGDALGLGPDHTPIHAFQGQGWAEWSEDLPEQLDDGAETGSGNGRDPQMPMFPMMPPGAGMGGAGGASAAGANAAGVGARGSHLPLMPMTPAGAPGGRNRERQRLTWLSEDAEVWGTHGNARLGILGLPQETGADAEGREVSPDVYEPVAVPHSMATPDVAGDEKNGEQGVVGNQRRDQS